MRSVFTELTRSRGRIRYANTHNAANMFVGWLIMEKRIFAADALKRKNTTRQYLERFEYVLWMEAYLRI